MKTDLVFDIEYSRHRSNTFGGKYEVNVASFDRYGYMLSFSYKWLGESKVHTLALPDFPGYEKDKENDYELVKELHKLFSECRRLIAHNGRKFDVPTANARFIYHRLPPPPPRPVMDTLLVARSRFNFPSNSLDDLASYLGIPGKLETAGKHLWDRCEQGDMKAWHVMKKYNAQDVVLLEQVYDLLAPWANNLPNGTTNFDEFIERPNCTMPGCLAPNVQSRGFRYYKSGRRREYVCNECGHWFVHGPLEKLTLSA